MPNTSWPAGTLSRAALAAAVLAIGEPQSVADRIAPPGRAAAVEAAERTPCEALLAGAATPEQRLALAEAAGCSYGELTNWVIRADLLRVEGLSFTAARALAMAGVVGVRDLAAWTGDARRLAQLVAKLTEVDLPLPADLPASLEQWGRQAGQLPARVISETSVILVVKGAGVQQAEDTLSAFVDGFWPAINQTDREANLTQRHDIFPPEYRSSPYDRQPLNLATQIQTGERRIWIKESYWEVACTPGSPTEVLAHEWRMATYALGSWIHELFAEQDTRLRSLPEARKRDPWRYLLANTFLNLGVLLHVVLTLTWALAAGVFPTVLPLHKWPPGLVAIALAAGVLLGVVAAIPPARATSQRMNAYYQADRKKPLPALPGMTGWFLVLLVLAFAISPWAYLLWVFFWVTVQVALLCARALAWPYRELVNSDSSTDDYYSIKDDPKADPGSQALPVYKRNNHMAFWRRVFVLNYRYIVVLGLPITFLGIMLARLLQWTRVLGNVGDAVENALSLILSSVLGDVVDYAMDPAQANRIRHVVQTDLMMFHDRPDVAHVHVLAHSQGTPITFETLFHYLPPGYRDKITTYVTIGSVLSYYHQSNPILDPVYLERFPRRPYPDFAEGFKWLNFWNLVDPITEFYGLDEYNLVQTALPLPLDASGQPDWAFADKQKWRPTVRYQASPTNIKTPATPQNHSEYWSNIPRVMLPFAKRVLGDLRPPEWDPEDLLKPPAFLPHAWGVTLLWLFWLLAFVPAALLVHLVWPWGTFGGPLARLLEEQVRAHLPSEPAWLTYVAAWFSHFISEFAAILATGAVYFAVILLLVVVYNLILKQTVTDRLGRSRQPGNPA